MESERNCTFTRLYSRSRYGAETQAVTMSSTTPCPQEAAVEDVVPRPPARHALHSLSNRPTSETSPPAIRARHFGRSGLVSSNTQSVSKPHRCESLPTTHEQKPATVPNPTAPGARARPASRGPLSTRPAPGSPPGLSTARQAPGSLRRPSASGPRFPGDDEAGRPSRSPAIRM